MLYATRPYVHAEKKLITALGVGISDRLRATCSNSPDLPWREPGYIHHHFTSHFEHGCRVLWALGLAHAVDTFKIDIDFSQHIAASETVKPEFPPYFRLCEQTEISERLSKSWPSPAPALDELIEAYLGLATDYGPADYVHLPTPRNTWFVPAHSEHEEPLKSFANAGYAARDGRGYKWTDRIAANMIAEHRWDERDFDSTHLNLAAIHLHATDLRTSLSAQRDANVSESILNCSIPWKALQIMRHWNGETWAEREADTTYLKFDAAIAVAQLLDAEIGQRSGSATKAGGLRSPETQ